MDDIPSQSFKKDGALIRSFQKLKKIYERMYLESRKNYGLTQNEIDILLFLQNYPQMDTAADISRCQSLSRSLVCKSVESLLASGYLIAREDKRDRRFLHLELTDQADRILGQLLKVRVHFWSILQKDITGEELGTFMRVLDKMDSNLKESFPDT